MRCLSKQTDFWTAAILYGVTLCFWLSYASLGFNPWDECVLANGALRILDGQMVWVDFFGYAPGRYLLAALCFKLGGNLLSIRIGIAVVTAVMPVMAYLVSRSFLPRGWALFPAILVMLVPSTYYVRFYPLLALLGAWSLLRLVEAPTRWSQAVHGLVLLVCFLFKTVSGGFILVLTPVALWAGMTRKPGMCRRVPRATLAVAGWAALAGAPVLAYYAIQGVLLEAVKTHLYGYVVTGTSLWVPYPNPVESLLAGDLIMAVEEAFFWSLALFLVAGLTLAASGRGGLWRRFAGSRPPAEVWKKVSLLVALGILNFLLPIYRAGLFNVLRASPIPWILGVMMSYGLWSGRFFGVGKGAGPRAPGCLGKGAAMLIMGYLAALALHLSVSPAFRNLSTGGAGPLLGQRWLKLEDQRAGVWMEPRHIELMETVHGWIEEATAEGEPIFAAPLVPLFYYFGQRPNPTGFDYILPGTWRKKAQREKTLDRLRKAAPKLFLYSDIAVDGLDSRRFKEYSQPIFALFDRNYAWTDVLGYPISDAAEAPVYNYRLLRPWARWNRVGNSFQKPRPTSTRGPVVPGNFECDGRRVSGWTLRPGGRMEIAVPAGDRLVFRHRILGPGDGWWSRPALRIRIAGAAGEEELFLSADPFFDDGLPPMAALAAGPLEGVITLEAMAESPEQLTGEVQILHPFLSSEKELFYARTEKAPPLAWGD